MKLKWPWSRFRVGWEFIPYNFTEFCDRPFLRGLICRYPPLMYLYCRFFAALYKYEVHAVRLVSAVDLKFEYPYSAPVWFYNTEHLGIVLYSQSALSNYSIFILPKISKAAVQYTLERRIRRELYRLPIEDMPLYINDDEPIRVRIAKERLSKKEQST